MNFIWEIYREINHDLIKVGLKTKQDYETHFKTHGIPEKRKYSIYEVYPDFHPIQYRNNYPDLNKLSGFELEKHWMIFGRHQKLSYLPLEPQIPPKIEVLPKVDIIKQKLEVIRRKEIIEITPRNQTTTVKTGSIFNKMDLHQIYISNDLMHLDRICKLYNVSIGRTVSKKILLFGLYNTHDYEVLMNHSSDVYIMWGGTDEMTVPSHIHTFILSSPHVYHIAISKDIEHRLQQRGYGRISYMELDLTNKEIFIPVEKRGNKIFIYNGYNTGQEEKYGKAIYEQVMDLLPQYEYILSNQLGGIPNEKMIHVYRECFIGLRLTEHDGNANMVGELKAMKIPVVHNISEYGLKWKTVEHVISHILEYRTNEGTCLDFFHDSIDTKKLAIIYRNIDEFGEQIKKYTNILFISSDYPGYGGAATNCNSLQQFFKKDHRVYAVYYNFDGEIHRKTESNPEYCIVDESKIDSLLKTLHFQPDLIILKCFVNKINIKSVFSCPVYYLVPGIYINQLDRHVDQLVKKEDHQRFINQSVLKQIQNSDMVFCNSNHTRLILKKIYGIQTSLFYSSFINYYGKERQTEPAVEDRCYEYALICSSFLRPIKNINTSIQTLKDKKNVILIGKGSSRWSDYGFTCLESVPSSQMENYYKQIKNVVQDSFYESCSNVKIEAWYNGCNLIRSKDIQAIDKNDQGSLLNRKEIHIIEDYEQTKYNTICKTIHFFNQLNMKLYYLLLSDQTQLIHDNEQQIRIQDRTKQYQIDNLKKEWLNHHLEQVFYSQSISNDVKGLTNLFKNADIYVLEQFQMLVDTKLTVFINFKCSDIQYGGGNQFSMNVVEFLKKFSNIRVVYELKGKIDIYLIVDIRKGPFKKYSFDQIYEYKKVHGGTIIYRVNDCDITRENSTLENMILEYSGKIDYFVFNSSFIKEYYIDKYHKLMNHPSRVIYNMANGSHFYPKSLHVNPKLRIVTHHWSDNINKGYDFYYKLDQYCRSRNDIEFVIFGRKFADGFVDPPTVHGPYKGEELGDRLRECDIYITASKYDSCPMHLLEALGCGLPVVYLDHPGGVKDICERTREPVGEPFNTIEECIEKIEKIKNQYEWYYNHIVNNISMYQSESCYAEYTKLFLEKKN